jgi:hypothetical protein
MTTPTIQNSEKISNVYSANAELSDGSELIPAEVAARAERQDKTGPVEAASSAVNDRSNGRSLKAVHGQTVDQEGLSNNYAIIPESYYQENQRFGFTRSAELLNGRTAMLGFIALIVTEVITGQSLVNILLGL